MGSEQSKKVTIETGDMKKFTRNFYTRNAHEVSKEILGKVLVHRSPEGTTSGKIVEVEAYIGPEDPASHAYSNRRTQRTEIQYKKGGYVYIYQIYGIHYCFNIVTGKKNKPETIFVRALEPVSGISLMVERRGLKTGALNKNKNLTDGPSKLCQAMGLNKSHYGEDLCSNRLFLLDSNYQIRPEDLGTSTRINIDYAGEAKNYLWRFYLKGNPYLSK